MHVVFLFFGPVSASLTLSVSMFLSLSVSMFVLFASLLGSFWSLDLKSGEWPLSLHQSEEHHRGK